MIAEMVLVLSEMVAVEAHQVFSALVDPVTLTVLTDKEPVQELEIMMMAFPSLARLEMMRCISL